MNARATPGAAALRDRPASGRPGDGIRADSARFMLGDWLVDVPTRRLLRAEQAVALEPRSMAVLAELCRRPREVVSAEALLGACWPDEPLGDNQVHKVIAGLRRALQDSATAPRYIETIRKQGYCLIAPIRVLSQQGARSHQGGWRGDSPFRGLEPFAQEHASVFFGRDDVVAALHARLAAQWRQGHGLVLLLGPSGSGKTSLVQAGLLPALALPPAGLGGDGANPQRDALRACTTATVDLAALSDLDPWLALAGAMLDWECAGAPLLAGHSMESLAQLLRDQCDEALRLLRIGLTACSLVRGDDPPAQPPLLVIDRLEALFQPAAENDAAAFIGCIDRLVLSRLVLVLAVCRNDFYPRLADHAALMRDKERGAHTDLAPPDAEAIAQIIRLPARAADLIYGTDPSGLNRLDDRLCADAMHAPDALPLLQYTLQELYLNRGAGNELTWESYNALGGLEGAIGRRAESILAGLPQPQQDALGRLLPRLIGTPAQDADPTGRWAPLAELDDDDERALVQALVAARLLVADQAGGSTGCRVAHEALLRRWPRVTSWVAQHRVALAAREELRPWVRRWLDGGRAGALLLPSGAALWQASRALAEAPSLFGEDERAFLAGSQRRLKRQVRWRWTAFAGALLLAVVAVGAAVGYADLARLASERERQSEQLASFMLGDLADQLRPIGKLDLLQSIGDQGLEVFGRGGVPGESPAEKLQRAKALVVIGEVNSSRGKGRTEVAMAALRQAGELLEPLQRTPGLDVAEVYRALGASAFWLGQIAFDAEDLDTAAREMSRYRDACERWLAAAPHDVNAKTELAYAFNSLGSIATKRGAWAEAGRWFESSLALKLALLAERPRDAALREAVANSRYWIGLAAHVQGQPAKALALYDDARAMQRELRAEHPDAVSRLRDLGVLEVKRAQALVALGRPGEALATMDEAVAWLKKAGEHDPSNLRWRTEKLHAQAGLLLMQLDAGLPVQAGLDDLKRQMSQFGEAKLSEDLWRETLARTATLEAEMAARQGQWRKAVALGAEADTKLQVVLGARPQNWQARELQARLGLLTVKAQQVLGDTAERANACARLGEQLQPAVSSGQAGLVLEAFLFARSCAGVEVAEEGIRERLTAGGYRPAQAALFQSLQSTRNNR